MPTISVPFAIDLTREDEWQKSRDHQYSFWIVRSHFMLRERQVNDVIKMGNKLGGVESPTGVSQEYVRSIKTELTAVQFRESFQEAMREDESLQEFASTLAAGIPLKTTRIGSELKLSVQQKLSRSFKESYRVRDVVTRRIEENYEFKYTVDPTVVDRLVAVAAYQRFAYDIYLTWVDYLKVLYRKTAFGLRKKRRKFPVAKNANHPNWIKFNLPLATALFWKPLPKSSLIVPERTYKNEVNDPEEIEIAKPQDTHKYAVWRPNVPTLYQISNVAFPLKWIHRKGDWTEDDLRRIEDEEAKNTAWFWQYGPGRTHRR